jgi:hypothetical protein
MIFIVSYDKNCGSCHHLKWCAREREMLFIVVRERVSICNLSSYYIENFWKQRLNWANNGARDANISFSCGDAYNLLRCNLALRETIKKWAQATRYASLVVQQAV